MAAVFEVVLLGGSSSLEYELDYNSRKTYVFLHKPLHQRSYQVT